MIKTDLTQEVKKLKIISMALIFGTASTVGIIIFLLLGMEVKMELAADEQNLMFMMFLGLSIFSFGGAYLLPNIFQKKIEFEKDENKRLSIYRSSLLIKMACYEVSAIFAAICFWFTGQYLVLIISALALYMQYTNIPDEDKVKNAIKIG